MDSLQMATQNKIKTQNNFTNTSHSLYLESTNMKLLILATLTATVLSLPATNNTTELPSILAREADKGKKSGLQLTTYSDLHCKGTVEINPNVQYGHNFEAEIYSYSLSRDLLPDERLDFSMTKRGRAMNPQCALYYKSAPVGQAKGCQPLGRPVDCFRLWHK